MIDELEFHVEITPAHIGWEDATPHLALLAMWAFHHKYFSNELNKDARFLNACKALEAESLTVATFVDDFLDGAVLEEYFSPVIAQFLSTYVSLGVYFGDLEKFFNASSIYCLPNTMTKLSSFYEVLNERCTYYQISGELPAFRTLAIKT